jgi:Spy/CpxP family protein refolding chaperone
MRPLFNTASVFAAIAASACLATGAMAQDQPAPQAMGPASGHAGDHAEWRRMHQQRRAQFLHDVLNIRQDQEPAFKAFVADLRAARGEHKDGADRPVEAAPLTTPERLDRMAAWMNRRQAERQAAFQHRAEAIKRFYAVLSPEQKRSFDALHDRGGMMMHGHHHGMEGPGDRHGGGPRGDDDAAG